jgi:hypothetical protein
MEAERRLPIRIRIGVPLEGLGGRLDQIRAWLDENCGSDGWALTPSGMRGVLNGRDIDLFSRCDTRERLRRAVVCSLQGGYGGGRISGPEGWYPWLGLEQGCMGRRNVTHALCHRGGSILRMPEQVRLSARRNASLDADGYQLRRNRQPSFRQ